MNNIEKIDFKLEKIKNILSKDTSNIDKYKEIANALYERIGKKELIEEWQILWMKDLRARGKSYEDLAKILGLSLSSIRYHVVQGEKEKMKIANSKNREKMRANPSAWKAYTEYQKEYQRRLARERKGKKEEKNENQSENQSENERSIITFESGLRKGMNQNNENYETIETENTETIEEKPGFFGKIIGKIMNKNGNGNVNESNKTNENKTNENKTNENENETKTQ